MVNNVVFIGRMTIDPEIRSSTNGSKFCNFRLAVNRNFKNKTTGEYDADFIPCVAVNTTAELIVGSIKKGHRLAVVGRMQTRNYDDKDGKKVYVVECFVENINFLENRNAPGETSNYQNNAMQQPVQNNQGFTEENDFSEIMDDDLPF